jgi:hypothetical protein
MECLRDALAGFDLDRHHDSLVAIGAEKAVHLVDVDDADMEELGMNRLEKRRFVRLQAKLRSGEQVCIRSLG